MQGGSTRQPVVRTRVVGRPAVCLTERRVEEKVQGGWTWQVVGLHVQEEPGHHRQPVFSETVVGRPVVTETREEAVQEG